MNAPNESTDPLRPAYPEAAGSGKTEVITGTRGREGRRNIAVLVVVGVVVLLLIFLLGRETEVPADEAAPLPTSVQ